MSIPPLPDSDDDLFANPFARAVADGVHPPRTLVRIGLVLLRVVLAVLLLGAATIPFAILIGLFWDGAGGNLWALAGGVATVAMTVAMGMGRARRARKETPAA